MKHVIYLNGPSSAGKSTLTKALQAAAQHQWLHIGIDKMIGMMPDKVNDWSEGVSRGDASRKMEGFCWDARVDAEGRMLHYIVCGPFARQLIDSLRAVVITLLECGHRVIIDDVSEQESSQAWRHALRDYEVVYVGLTAPVEEIEAREQARGDRAVGSGRVQHGTVHQGVNYDLFFDTTVTPTDEIVRQILARAE